MAHVVLDAFALAAPASDSPQSVFEAYLQRLLDLEDLERQQLVSFVISAQAFEVLADGAAYPFVEAFPQDKFPQRADVLRIVTGLTHRLKVIEDITHVRDILVDQAACSPAEAVGGRLASFQSHFYWLTACLALDALTASHALLPVVVTGGVDKGSVAARVEANIVDVEWMASAPLPALALRFPAWIASELLLCGDARGMCANISAVDLWVRGHWMEALQIAMHQERTKVGKGDWPVSRPAWTLGPEFLRSLKGHNFDSDRGKAELLISVLCDIVLGRSTSKAHALRANKSPGSGQVVRRRDDAKAVRHDVDYEYHVHYWKTPTNLEFASVVVHNDFSIPA